MKKNLKKLNFNYDLGGLAAYVDALSPDIISEAVLSPRTMQYVNTIVGIKGTQNVNLLSETLEVQTGTSCGWTNSGLTTFTTAAITVQPYKVNQSLCLEELNTLWLGQYLNAGSYNEGNPTPFEQAIIDLQTKQIKRFNEDTIWNASSATTASSGFIELLNNTAGVVALTGQTALCNVTGSTPQLKAEAILTQIDNLIENLDRNVFDRDDIIIYMSQTQFSCYLKALRTVNNFHFTEPTLGQVYETFHPQTHFKVVSIPGLNGSDLIVAAPQQYMLLGTDLASDEDSYRAWWSQDFQEVRIMAAWKLGAALAFPQFIVTNGL